MAKSYTIYEAVSVKLVKIGNLRDELRNKIIALDTWRY